MNQLNPLSGGYQTKKTALTFRVNVQLCSEAKRAYGDIGRNPQQELSREGFAWFLGLFVRHPGRRVEGE